MSSASIFLWIEQHPGLASWVQAVGSIIALIFAVWLPAHARSADKKKAVDGRKALLIVLLTDIETVILNDTPEGPSTSVEALSNFLKKLDMFLASETNLEIAREVMAIREGTNKLLKTAGTAYFEIFWDVNSPEFLKLIREVTVRMVEGSPGILPKPSS